MARQNTEDGGLAWVILVMNSLSHVIEATMIISPGLYQVEFLKMFSSSTSVASLPPSIFMSLQLLLGPIAGTLSTIFGNRQVIIFGSVLFSVGLLAASMVTELPYILLTYGICAGTGFGLCFTPQLVIVGHYFVKKRALANGITLAVSGLGFGFGPYLMILLIQNYGFRTALMVSACLTMQMCVAAATYFPSKAEKPRNRAKKSRRSERKHCTSSLWYLKQINLWIMCLNYGFQIVGWAVHAVHFPGYAESQGIDPHSLSQMFIAFGLTMSVSRFLCGVLCNDASVSMVVVLSGTQGCQGIITLLMPFYAKTYAGCMAYQILMSFFFGAALVPITPLTAELFGVDHLAAACGWIMMIAGLSGLGGPILAGWLRDVSGNYSSGFFTAGLFEIAGSLLVLLIPICRKSYPENNEERSIPEVENMVELDEQLPEIVSVRSLDATSDDMVYACDAELD